MAIELLTVTEVSKLLEDNKFDEEVVQIFLDNKIDGSSLLELTTAEMKELGIVALGDRKRLERVIKTMPVTHSSEAFQTPRVCCQ